jgi:hypothetical protein
MCVRGLKAAINEVPELSSEVHETLNFSSRIDFPPRAPTPKIPLKIRGARSIAGSLSVKEKYGTVNEVICKRTVSRCSKCSPCRQEQRIKVFYTSTR